MRNVVIYRLGACGMSEGNKSRTVLSMKREENALDSLGIVVSSSVYCVKSTSIYSLFDDAFFYFATNTFSSSKCLKRMCVVEK